MTKKEYLGITEPVVSLDRSNNYVINHDTVMTENDLSQLYYLNREIEDQQERLSELEDLATSCSACITGLPKAARISDKVAKYAAEIADLKTMIERNIARCFCELDRLNRYIESIKDSETRMILSLRYINGLSWREIAFSIGKNDESSVRKKMKKFFENAGQDDLYIL